MAVKAKRKTAPRAVSKTSSVSMPKPLSINLRQFDTSVILKNKKLSGALGIAFIVIVLLLVIFKSLFIAAVVNGQPIWRVTVVKALEAQSGKTTLDSIITKTLILQEAKKRNITITQSDIDAQVNIISNNLKSQGSTLDQALATQGMTKADLNDEIKVQVAINKMVGTDVSVTQKEIDDYVTANQAQKTANMTDAEFTAQETQALKQQKLQTKTQEFVSALQAKAKVARFVSY